MKLFMKFITLMSSVVFTNSYARANGGDMVAEIEVVTSAKPLKSVFDVVAQTGLDWPSIITILLALITALLTVLGIALIIVAFWSYKVIERNSATVARETATEIADAIAKEIAEKTATDTAKKTANNYIKQAYFFGEKSNEEVDS